MIVAAGEKAGYVRRPYSGRSRTGWTRACSVKEQPFDSWAICPTLVDGSYASLADSASTHPSKSRAVVGCLQRSAP